MSLVNQSQSETEKLITQMISDWEALPTSETFFDIGTALEVVILDTENKAIAGLRELFASAALRWLRNGTIENAIFTSIENIYHCSLLCHLASLQPDFVPEDAKIISDLLNGGIVTRSELPVLTQYTVAYHFANIAAHQNIDALARRNISNMIDKRVLRARSDEYDVLVLIMLTQIRKSINPLLGNLGLLNQVLLVQALRSEDLNRVAILLYLGCKMEILPESLKSSASAFLEQHNPSNDLHPLPTTGDIDHEYTSRASRGLRIRSTIAQSLIFNHQS